MRTDNSSSYAVLRIEYFDGHSPIGVDGIEISSLEDRSLPDLIPWLQIIQAKVLSPHEIELLISSKKTTSSILQIHLTLDGKLLAKNPTCLYSLMTGSIIPSKAYYIKNLLVKI